MLLAFTASFISMEALVCTLLAVALVTYVTKLVGKKTAGSRRTDAGAAVAPAGSTLHVNADAPPRTPPSAASMAKAHALPDMILPSPSPSPAPASRSFAASSSPTPMSPLRTHTTSKKTSTDVAPAERSLQQPRSAAEVAKKARAETIMSRVRRLVRRTVKGLIFRLPKSIKYPIIRRLIKFKPTIDPRITVRLASSVDDYAAAFRIIGQAYREQGFIPSDDDVCVMNKYQLLPNTAIVVALYDERIVGTVTFVHQNPLGYPLQRAFDIDHIIMSEELAKAPNYNVPCPTVPNAGLAPATSTLPIPGTEVTCLAIDRTFRRDSGFDLLFPLMKYVFEYAFRVSRTLFLFAATFPRDSDFYQALLTFVEISERSYVADYVGAPAEAFVCDLRAAPPLLHKFWSHLPPRQNLFAYLDHVSPQLHLPKSMDDPTIVRAGDVLPALLARGFSLPNLTQHEKDVFKQLYRNTPEVAKCFE